MSKEAPVADAPKPHSVNIIPARGPKGSGTTVSANLADWPAMLKDIRDAAEADDRDVSNWLRRRLIKLYTDGVLIDGKGKPHEEKQ